MKKVILCILFSIPILLKGQKFDYPQYKEKDSHTIEILSIEITDYSTIIKFVHTAPDYYINGGWVNLQKNIYLKDENGTKHSLIRAEGIPLSPNKHENSYKGEKVYFTAYFKKLPPNISHIDIIECPNSNDCFNFYGVKLTDKNSVSFEKFRKDFSIYAIYEPKTGWSEWEETNSTIVFNINDNGDFTIYYPSGSTETYRNISKVTKNTDDDGEEYQWMLVLNEKGEKLGFKLHSKGAVQFLHSNGTIFQLDNFK